MALQSARHLAVEAIQHNDTKAEQVQPTCETNSSQGHSVSFSAATLRVPNQLQAFARIRHLDDLDEAQSSKRKRVRFADSEVTSLTVDSLDSGPGFAVQRHHSSTPSHICEILLNGACLAKQKVASCPGLYEACRGHFKHRFHSSADCLAGICSSKLTMPTRHAMSLRRLIEKPRNDVIGMSDQFRLARRLVLGVLQYHSTQWLPEKWSSDDLALFWDAEDVSDDELRTLHLAKDAHHVSAPQWAFRDARLSMEGIEQRSIPSTITATTTSEDAAALYGISNMTLYSLGVVLLEIGYWTPLDAADVGAVRKLVDRHRARFPLSLRYRELVRKCLSCDFGFGNDLGERMLQRAVFSNVVSELDDLIELTSKLDVKGD